MLSLGKDLKLPYSKKNPSMHIVGEARNGEELIKEVERKKPDIVLTDIQMPVMNGSEASRIINTRFSVISVIALTVFSDTDAIFKMFESGAKGYVMKTADIDEVSEAINTVYSGEMYYCNSSSTNLIKKIGPGKYNHFKRSSAIHLTDREIEIIRLISFQLTLKEVADKMNISSRTVEEHSYNIKRKIDAKNNVGIALYALKNNIISTEEI